MKIAIGFPPNIQTIRAVLPIPPHSLFTYGDTIYNPSGRTIPDDQVHHEEVHQRQQGSDPEAWWSKYLMDPKFRLSQEVEAYGNQYAFALKYISRAAADVGKEGKRLAAGKGKLVAYAKESMSRALSSEAYGSMVSFSEAESLIRRFAKTL